METAKPIDKSKYSNATTFKKGDNRVRKPKGALHPEAIAKKVIRQHTSDILQYMNDGGTNSGIAALLADIDSLPLRERVTARLTLLEYVKPKLGRVEIITKPENKVISIFGKLVDSSENYTELS